MRLQELLHEQRLDRRRPIADLVIRRCALLSSSRFSVEPATGAQPRRRNFGQRHHRIVRIVVGVAQRDAEHPLAHQGAQLMFDQPPIALIHEAGGQAIDQPDRPIWRPAAAPASEVGAIERGDHGTVLDGCKTEQIREWASGTSSGPG